MYELHKSFPTISSKNVPVPDQQPNNGWYHPSSAPLSHEQEVQYVSPTWSGQADELIRSGAMPETSYHYPSGGIRPGNNEPEFLGRFVSTMGGDQLCQPHQKTAPFDPKPFGFETTDLF
nr:hypothetical protein TetV2_00516 [Oceanusvirus sp.]